MNHLAKHIEKLVWQHECVIVPQFGGFVTQVQSASITEAEGLFVPPTRTVGFNDKLLGNDGILVRSYMKMYGLAETEAKRLLQTDILEMREQLLHHGFYDLGHLGILKQNEDGEILFTPNSGWTVPEYFGLETFDFPRLTETFAVEYPQEKPDAEQASQKHAEHITLHINRRMLHTALSIAAAIFLFFLVSTPLNTNLWHKNQALLAQDILSSALAIMPRMETHPSARPDTICSNTLATGVEVATESKSEKPAQKTELEANNLSHEFAVVIASAIPKENALDYVNHLQKKGYTDVCIHQHGAMVRVLFRGFETEADARKKMQTLQGIPDFQGAWILELK